MASVAESKSPLAHAFDVAGLLSWTGPGLLLALASLFLVRGQGLLKVTFLGLCAAGVSQARFTELLVPFMALLAGLAGAELAARFPRAKLALVLPALLLLQGLPALQRVQGEESAKLTWQRGVRAASLWLRDAGKGRVLAQWDLGHSLVQHGRRGVLASNFGGYLGREPWIAPWRTLAAREDTELEKLLEHYGVEHLLWTSRWQRNEEPWLRELKLKEIPSDALVQRLEHLEDVPPILRLVYESPRELLDRVHETDAQPLPVARVFERVRGAVLVAYGEPGEKLLVSARLVIEGAATDRIVLRSALVDDSGEVSLRWPYCSDEPQGLVRVEGGIRWSLGGQSEVLDLSDGEVRAGAHCVLN